MRSFILFVALLGLALVLAAAVTYPAWLLVGTISVEPVHRVMNRVAMLFAVFGLIYLTRRLGVADRASLGYGLPRREFMRQLAIGWVGAMLLMAPLSALLLGLGVREVIPDLDVNLLGLVVGGIVSGFAIALIEETFFRGALLTAIARTSSALTAVIASSLLYASLHFLGGRLSVPNDEVSWIHGFSVLVRLFERYYDPLAFIDSFVALAMLGVLLALVRLRTGAIAGCIGLHAGGVCAIAVLRKTTSVAPQAEFGELVGTYDGVIGWAALCWFALIALAYWFMSGRTIPASRAAGREVAGDAQASDR